MSFDSDIQILARVLVATREDDQISSEDARRLTDLANFGSSYQTTSTLPEERRSSSIAPTTARTRTA